MGAAPKSLHEVRVSITGSFLTNHLNAATDSWALTNTDIHKIRALDYDESGLKQDGLEDVAIQTRHYDKPAPIPGLRVGTLKLSMPAGGEYSNIMTNPAMNILSVALGGIALPTSQRSATVAATSGGTTTNIPVATASTFVVAGQAILLGVRGDGRGNGEVRPIANVGTTYVTAAYPFSAAPASGDPVIFSTTVYPNGEATQLYLHTLGLGHATTDQTQTISGSATAKLSKLGVGELPQFDFEISPADWRPVPTTDRTTASQSAAYRGTPPAFDKSIGFFHFDDLTAQTRNVKQGGDFSVDFGVKCEAIPAPGGVNGIGDWCKQPGVPSAEFKIVRARPSSVTDEDMPGISDDFTAQTAKRAMFQFGHSNGKCLAIEFPMAYIAERPTTDTLGAFSAIKVKIHGAENSVATTNIEKASVRIHAF